MSLIAEKIETATVYMKFDWTDHLWNDLDSVVVRLTAVNQTKEMEKNMTMKEVRAALEGVIADGVSKNKAGNFVARKGYFYHHGQSSETFAAKVAAALPKAIILNKWDHMAPFRGGASLAKSSHFGVEFKF